MSQGRRPPASVLLTSASGLSLRHADKGSLHAAVAAAAELRTGDFVPPRRRGGELNDALPSRRNLNVDLQITNGEPMFTIRGANDEPDRLPSRHLDDRWLERVLFRRDLHFMHGVCAGQ